jgi:hypothetical protein
MKPLFVISRRVDAGASAGDVQRRLLGARLLLLTGTGGSGKRIVGNMLVDERSFVHIDLDNPHANRRFLGNGVEGLRSELEANLEPGQDLVVTWTPSRHGALPFVRVMQSYGFDWVWFDGDRGAGFHGFFSVKNAEAARFVDSFAEDGSFRPLAAVLAEVLEPGPVAQPVPERRRVRAAAARAHMPRATWLRPTAAHLRSRTAAAVAVALAILAALGGGAYSLFGGLAGQKVGDALALQSAHAKPAALPQNGVLVSGESLAGVRLGDTTDEVRKLWGRNFTVWEGHTPITWFYFAETGDPVGAGVVFREGRVTAVFTLGAKRGWRTDEGVKVGDYLSTQLLHDEGNWTVCAGYSAKSEESDDAVTSILAVGPVVYGFSLTRPDESVCH